MVGCPGRRPAEHAHRRLCEGDPPRRGVQDNDRKDWERDYALSKLLQIWVHVAGENVPNLETGRAPGLLAVMRERLFVRIPVSPYNGLV